MILTLSRLKSFQFQAVYDLFFLISTNTVYTMAALLTSQQVLCCREIIDLHTQTMSPVIIVKVSSWIELSPISVSSHPARSPHLDSAHPHIFDWQVIISSCFILIHHSLWDHHLFFAIIAIIGRVELRGPTLGIIQLNGFHFSFTEKIEKANSGFFLNP